MNIAVVYIYAGIAGEQYKDYARRFVASYHANPPKADHQTIVVLNGSKKTNEICCLFSSLPKLEFIEHNNVGHDIGGYLYASRVVPCDLMVFFGASTYFKGDRWLHRVEQSFSKHGSALYGVMGNNGDQRVRVYPHIRTTGFWIQPTLLNQYPFPRNIHTKEQRYEFEHGRNSLCEWLRKKHMAVWVVTWDGEYLWPHWDSIPNGFHRGDQSALLFGDHISEPPFYHTP